MENLEIEKVEIEKKKGILSFFKKISFKKKKKEKEGGEEGKTKKSKKKIWLFVLGGFLLLILVLGLAVAIPGKKVYQRGMALKDQGLKTKAVVAQKDLGLLKSELDKTGEMLGEVEGAYRALGWLKIVPWVKDYYFDGQRALEAGKEGLGAGKIVIEGIEPYQDFLGLGEEEKEDGGKTAEDRIEFLTGSIAGLKPQLDSLEESLNKVAALVEEIDPERYPEEYKGMVIKSNLIQGKRLLSDVQVFLKEGKPLIARLDYLLGKEEPRKYLVLFQNDAEIRPTGGFWTAYGILEVDNGKIKPLVSEDIYSLDARFNSSIPSPEPLKKYLKNNFYWNLRDMNLSPDFKVSVEEFWPHYQKAGIQKEVDGIIAVDTNVLVSILEVIGRIGVPGWGNFYADPDDRCFGCPQVVYLLEELADRPTSSIRAERKGFIAPIMHSLLANAMGQPKEKIAPLAQAVIDDMNSKHILFYFFDEELQKGIEKLGYGGRIKEFEGDYFHLSDTNLGGAKSNLFIKQEIRHDYEVKGGKISKKVSVKYENTAEGSNCNLEVGDLCLNGLYRDWFRFYLPSGSKLEKMTGSEEEAKVYEELDKGVVEGFFGNKFPLHPKGISKVTIEYTLPFEAKENLSLLVQKQPGKDAVKHLIYVNGKKQQVVEVDGDVVIDVKL